MYAEGKLLTSHHHRERCCMLAGMNTGTSQHVYGPAQIGCPYFELLYNVSRPGFYVMIKAFMLALMHAHVLVLR